MSELPGLGEQSEPGFWQEGACVFWEGARRHQKGQEHSGAHSSHGRQPCADRSARANTSTPEPLYSPGCPDALVCRMVLFDSSIPSRSVPFHSQKHPVGGVNDMIALPYSEVTLCSLTLQIILPPQRPESHFPLFGRRDFEPEIHTLAVLPTSSLEAHAVPGVHLMKNKSPIKKKYIGLTF